MSKKKQLKVVGPRKITKGMVKEQVERLGYFTGRYIPEGDNRPTLEKRLKDMLESALVGHPDPVIVEMLKMQIDAALKGDKGALELLLDRAYGKSVQSLNVVQPPPVNIQHNVINIDNLNGSE